VGAGLYDGALKEAIHRLKFSGWTFLAPALAALLTEAVGSTDLWTADVVVPVPLHPKRFIERGFNQSALLAGGVAGALSTRLDTEGLRRLRPTESQVGLRPVERSRNVRGAFRTSRPGTFLGRRVLLIDDVLTTGSTAGDCARALSDDGAASVDLAVLAVAPRR
jgi:ComF family protein